MPKILWATTFSADLWEHSGKVLLETFHATGTPGLLAAYAEGMDVPAAANVVTYRIDDDPTLKSVTAANRDVIPVALGGTLGSPECGCPGGPLDVHSNRHRLPCPGYWFCKNAIRWFRKPLAAHLACQRYAKEYDYLMWVDSDASFLQHTPERVVESWFGGPKNRVACVYLKSRRTAIETGVFGYNLKYGGPRVAAAVLQRYVSKKFRRDKRWDDCVQLEYGIRDAQQPAKDLAKNVGPNNTVIQFSPLGAYLGHNKGHHRRTGALS